MGWTMNTTKKYFRVVTRKNVTLKKNKKKLQRVKLGRPTTPTKKMNGSRMIYLTSESTNGTTSSTIASSSDYYFLPEVAYNLPNDRSFDSAKAQKRLMPGVNKPEMEWNSTGIALIAITLIAILALGAFGLMFFTRISDFMQVNGDDVDNLKKCPKITDKGKKTNKKTKNKLKLNDKKESYQKPSQKKIVKKSEAHLAVREGMSAAAMKHVQASGATTLSKDAIKRSNFHEVMVIDTENVLQFCDKDTENRFEMMFGDSKVTAQLFDVKLANKKENSIVGNKNLVSRTETNENKKFYNFNALSDSKSSSISSNEETLKSQKELENFIACIKENILLSDDKE